MHDIKLDKSILKRNFNKNSLALKFTTKIVAIFLFFFTKNEVFSQLSLESIFLQQEYKLQPSPTIQFLHQQSNYVKVLNEKNETLLEFYNKEYKKINDWKISKTSTSSAIRDVSFSNTDKYILARTDCAPLFRHSLACRYFISDSSGMLQPINSNKVLFPSFSPDDKFIAYISNNDIFYKNIDNSRETQITSDGEWNKIINGKGDWVNEEEFALSKAYEWNPKSNQIAYIKFDESEVKTFSIPEYYDMQYPNYFNYKYPKVGEKNAKLSVHIYQLKNKKTKSVSIPYAYEYIPRIYWNKSGTELIMLLMNRNQDTMRLVAYNTSSKMARLLYLETDTAYVNIPIALTFLNNNSFIITSAKNGYNHLYHYDENGKLLQQITNGNYEIKQLYGIDETNHWIYYQSNEGNEIETAIYRIHQITHDKEKLSNQNGSNSAIFAKDFSRYLHQFSSATTPPTYSIRNTNDTATIVLVNNQDIQKKTENIPQKKFIQIPNNDNYLNAWIITPKAIDTTQKYPLFIYTYGGPESQSVENKWSGTRDLFLNFLAEQGYFVACIDNRGTDGRGKKFKQATFKQLGKLETEDQTQAVQYLCNQFPIDKNNVCIYGWSYGGYLAANCLLQPNSIFKTAIAAAPITNWKLYNTIYTERYMRTPTENASAYANFQPEKLAKNLQGNLMLIHGTADDNVQLQHTLRLIQSLNTSNKNYQLYLYPDEAHGLGSSKLYYDLYRKIFNYLKEKN